HEHDRTTLAELDRLPVGDDLDRVASEALRERLTLAMERHVAAEHLRDIRILGSPMQSVRMVFDLMPHETEDQWRTIAERMALVPQGLDGLRDALLEGIREGVVAARRHAVACARQCDTWAGLDAGTRPFFPSLVDGYDARGGRDGALGTRLRRLA